MTDTLQMIPLDQIDDAALARDRSHLDAEALNELTQSIAVSGLRMPVEVFQLADPAPDGALYGLISGFRRIAAFRAQHAATGQARYAEIPAFVRAPASIAAAVAAMVEENDIRAELSPWDRGRVAVTARDQGVFATIEEAVERLYPMASKQKRTRLRAFARVADALDGCLAKPESLNQLQVLRLDAALRAGFGPIIRAALGETSLTDPESQWQAVLPFLIEAERSPEGDAAPGPARSGRPRRILTPRQGLVIRREMSRDGWILRFTGREATGPLIDLVLDEIERMFSPG